MNVRRGGERAGEVTGWVVRGTALGAAAGVTAGAVELACNLWVGALVPAHVAAVLGAIYAAAGALVGGALGGVTALVGGRERRARIYLAAGPPLIVLLYGLGLIYNPASLRGELLLAGGCAAFGVLLYKGLRRVGDGFASTFAAVIFVTLVVVVTATYWLRARDDAMGAVREVGLLLGLGGVAAWGQLRFVGTLSRFSHGAAGALVVAEVVALGLAVLLGGERTDTRPLDLEARVRLVGAEARPNVVVLSVDTLRADRLSLYGYAKPTTPHIDAFARDGVVYERCYSTSGWTLPAYASILTGLMPSRHGAHRPVRDDSAGSSPPGAVKATKRGHIGYPLAEDNLTLPEILRAHGYTTAAVVANPGYLSRDFGMAQGFDYYDDSFTMYLPHRPLLLSPDYFPFLFSLLPKSRRTAREVNRDVLRWLDRDGQPPFFLLVNYMDTHSPLYPWDGDPSRWGCDGGGYRDIRESRFVTGMRPEALACLNAAYDAQVNFVDEAIGALLAELKRRDLYESSLVIFTADHGEMLGEHGMRGHGYALYEQVVRVPLVIKYPGGHAPGHENRRVQLLDLMPTILDVAGVPVPERIAGQVLPDVTHETVIEQFAALGDPRVTLSVLYDGDYKLIHSSRGEQWLFDLAADPGERRDVATEERQRAAALRARLGEMGAGRTRTSRARAGRLRGETLQQLRALGYVGEGGEASRR